MQRLKEVKWKTPEVTICDDNRYNLIYEGSIKNIPEFLKDYQVIKYTVNKVKNFTFITVFPGGY